MQSLDNSIATHHQICPLPGTFHATFDEPHRKPTVTFAPLGPRSMPFWCPSTNCFARWLHSLDFLSHGQLPCKRIGAFSVDSQSQIKTKHPTIDGHDKRF